MITAIEMLKILGVSTDPEYIAYKCIQTMPMEECDAAIASITDPAHLDFIIRVKGVSSYEAVLKNPHCDTQCLNAMWEKWRSADTWDFTFLRSWAMHPNVDYDMSKEKRQDIAGSLNYYENYIMGRLLSPTVTKEEVMEYWGTSDRWDAAIIRSSVLTDEDCRRLVGRNSSEKVLVAFAERMHIDS